jgi:hypothetical protein
VMRGVMVGGTCSCTNKHQCDAATHEQRSDSQLLAASSQQHANEVSMSQLCPPKVDFACSYAKHAEDWPRCPSAARCAANLATYKPTPHSQKPTAQAMRPPQENKSTTGPHSKAAG